MNSPTFHVTNVALSTHKYDPYMYGPRGIPIAFSYFARFYVE